MAKYTMLLAEYLEMGGQLPASFAEINGFTDLFKAHYCDKELGFESELLFFMKLSAKADVVIPLYKDKLTHLASEWQNFDNPIRTINVIENKKFNAGAQKGKTTELPFDETEATPSVVNDSDAYENKEQRGTTTKESGSTHDETMKGIEFLSQPAKKVMYDLLDEFKTCFMLVY